MKLFGSLGLRTLSPGRGGVVCGFFTHIGFSGAFTHCVFLCLDRRVVFFTQKGGRIGQVLKLGLSPTGFSGAFTHSVFITTDTEFSFCTEGLTCTLALNKNPNTSMAKSKKWLVEKTVAILEKMRKYTTIQTRSHKGSREMRL